MFTQYITTVDRTARGVFYGYRDGLFPSSQSFLHLEGGLLYAHPETK